MLPDRTIRVAQPDPNARHGRTLLPAIEELLASTGLQIADLEGLVVGLGPGSYTGLRVGLTAAKTLAFAIARPLATLDSLELVGRNAPEDALRVSVIADAQRGDLYVADFVRESAGAPLVQTHATQLASIEEWQASLPASAFVLGPALTVPRIASALTVAARRPDTEESHWPDPRRLADLALERWPPNPGADIFFLEPAYLRRSAAEDQWERKQSTPSPG